MARIVRGILLCFLAVLVMSHNTHAIDFTFSVASYWAGGAPASVEWVSENDPLTAGQFVCAGGTDYRSKFYGINIVLDSNMAGQVRSGDVFELDLSGTADDNSNLNIDFTTNLYDYEGNFDILDVRYESAGMSAGRFKFIMMAKRAGAYSLKVRRVGGGNFFSLTRAGGWECISAGNWVAYHIVGDGSQAIINAINNNNSSQAIEDAKDAIVDAIEDAQDKEEQAAQDAVDDAEDASDSSQDSVDAAGQSLISAMTQIGTALMNTQASDCTINTATNHFTMGTLDLCSNVPQGIRTFVSGLLAIVLTPIILYYCFHIVNYIYNLFQEFQR